MTKRRVKDHTQLICDIGEISGLFSDSSSLENFLQKIVDMIAAHMGSEVCSIYLYDERNQELILKATKGLNSALIGKVRMKLGEGLTGLALKELRPISERHASKNPNFKSFLGLGEEGYESFLAVPILRGNTMIGAMVIQNKQRDYFADSDTLVLKAISSQLANTIEMTRLFLLLDEKPQEAPEAVNIDKLGIVKGKVGARGFAYAEAVVIDQAEDLSRLIRESETFTEKDFRQAVIKTEEQLESFQESVEEKLSDVASLIFDAQILMLKDQPFIDAIIEQIRSGLNPPLAIKMIVELYMKRFQNIPNAYLREKIHDVYDIGRRLIENLVGENQAIADLQGRIVIAPEVYPTDILKFSSQDVKGIVLLSGGVTSHVSILSQSLQMPLIIADEPKLLKLPQRTRVLMDAEQGSVIIAPSKEVLATYKDREDAINAYERLKQEVKPATTTKDGTPVRLLANINLLSDLENARNFKAEGIGLYRTEFPFIVRSNFPSEEEQYVVYNKLCNAMTGKEITFRTLDIGGDKVLSYFQDHHKEKNPYMGMRSIRFSLQHTEVFEQQIRAILRAGVESKLRIMFPMISSVDEFVTAKKIVMGCVKDLTKRGYPCHQKPEVGLMIELPSVMEIIEDLASEADFFSIGTNDFIQYMLAVDRTNEKVADLYLPHHPSVLRAINRVVAAGLKHKIDVSVCGDMVHNPKYIPYILGMGVRKISLNPIYIPHIQKMIRKTNIAEARKAKDKILSKSRLKDIEELIA